MLLVAVLELPPGLRAWPDFTAEGFKTLLYYCGYFLGAFALLLILSDEGLAPAPSDAKSLSIVV